MQKVVPDGRQKKLNADQVEFIERITERYPVRHIHLAKLFNVSACAIQQRTTTTSLRPRQREKVYPIAESAVKHCWKWFQETGEINETGLVFKPGVDKAALTKGCIAWLEDNVGWHSMKWLSKRLDCSWETLRTILRQADLIDTALQYSCRGVVKQISEVQNYHIPKGRLESLCRDKILRWYWEGRRKGRAMIILPHDAKWLIENYTPTITIPVRPGGSRYC